MAGDRPVGGVGLRKSTSEKGKSGFNGEGWRFRAIGFGKNYELNGIINGAPPHLRSQGFQNFYQSRLVQNLPITYSTVLQTTSVHALRIILCFGLDMVGRKAKPSLWPPAPAEWGVIGDFECRLKAGTTPHLPPVLVIKQADKNLKLPAATSERASRMAEHLDVKVHELPEDLLVAACAVQHPRNRSRSRSCSHSRSRSPSPHRGRKRSHSQLDDNDDKPDDPLGFALDIVTESSIFVAGVTALMDDHRYPRRRYVSAKASLASKLYYKPSPHVDSLSTSSFATPPLMRNEPNSAILSPQAQAGGAVIAEQGMGRI